MQCVTDKPMNRAIRQAFDRALAIDLSPIRRKLMDKQHGSGWTPEEAESAERLYRCFLALCAAYAETEHRVVPPPVVDDYWHQHILDTRKYAADCDAMFGRFLHHFPYFGMRGPDDELALNAAGAWTRSQLSIHFGEDVRDLVVSASCTSGGSCSSCRDD